MSYFIPPTYLDVEKIAKKYGGDEQEFSL